MRARSPCRPPPSSLSGGGGTGEGHRDHDARVSVDRDAQRHVVDESRAVPSVVGRVPLHFPAAATCVVPHGHYVDGGGSNRERVAGFDARRAIKPSLRHKLKFQTAALP